MPCCLSLALLCSAVLCFGLLPCGVVCGVACTGWHDIDLSENGQQEAIDAGKIIKEKGLKFDIVFTSVLRRAIKTAWTVCMESDNFAMPIINSWRLNERHYGGLQGLNKADTAAKYGDDQVKIWRRSYDVPPPEIEASDPRHPSNDTMYRHVPKSALPGAESLKLTVDRVLPFWFDHIAPCVMAGKSVMVSPPIFALASCCDTDLATAKAKAIKISLHIEWLLPWHADLPYIDS